MTTRDRKAPNGCGEPAQQRAEEALAHLAAIVQSAQDAIVGADPDGNILTWNPAAERLFGYTPDEVIGRSIAALSSPDQHPHQRELIARLIRGERLTPFETIRLGKDGRRVPVSLSLSAVRHPDGRLLGFSGSYRDLTAEQQARDALRRSEEQHRELFERNPHPMWVYETETLRFLAVNDAAVSQYGYSRDEFLGMSLADIRPPEDVPALVADVRESPSGLQRNGVWRHRLKDGRVREVEVASHAIRYDGRPCRLVMPADVTDRRRAEAALREREELLRNVITHIPCGVFWKNRDSVYLGCNDRVARDLGFGSPDQLVGRTDHDFGGDPGEADSFRVRDQEVMRTGEPVLDLEETRTRLGMTTTLLTSKVPLRDAAGAVVGVLGIYLDITARKRAEEEREKFVALVERSADFVGMADLDGRVFYLNPAGRQLVGLDPGRPVRDTRIEDYVPADVAAFYREVAIPQVLATGRWEGETRFKHFATGRPLDVQQCVFAVRSPAGDPVCLATVVRDVTGAKRLEEQLRQSQKMDAVGQLAGGIAHDFNNLLTVINGYADIAVEAIPAGHPTREMVTEIRKAGERAAGLTRQLLAFSRKAVLAPRVVDPNALVLDVERMLRRVIGEDVDLAVRLQPGVGAVHADPGQLEQVLLNLCVNARDAMPRGGKLTVETRDVELDDGYARAHPEVRPGWYVLLAVTDTGCGIPADVLPHVFEPFFTTKGPGKGTGLGLATVYGIVRQAGGHVGVYSEPGVGTTFKVYLPRSAESCRPSPGGSGDRAPPGGTETILLVEDEEAVRALAGFVLRRAGYIVLEAGSGEEALRVAAQHAGPLDLVVTDVVMPGFGGRELAERLGAARPGLGVLFLSGYTDDAVVRHGVLEEHVNFLQKPFKPTALAAKVRDVLDQGRASGPTKGGPDEGPPDKGGPP